MELLIVYGSTEGRKTPLTDKKLKYLEQLLLQKRAEAQEKFDQLRNTQSNLEEADDADFSSITHHLGDWASDEQQLQMNYTLLERTRGYIQGVNEAFERIENKTYGICLATGKPISRERLKAVPHTLYSIEAKQKGLAADD